MEQFVITYSFPGIDFHKDRLFHQHALLRAVMVVDFRIEARGSVGYNHNVETCVKEIRAVYAVSTLFTREGRIFLWQLDVGQTFSLL